MLATLKAPKTDCTLTPDMDCWSILAARHCLVEAKLEQRNGDTYIRGVVVADAECCGSDGGVALARVLNCQSLRDADECIDESCHLATVINARVEDGCVVCDLRVPRTVGGSLLWETANRDRYAAHMCIRVCGLMDAEFLPRHVQIHRAWMLVD